MDDLTRLAAAARHGDRIALEAFVRGSQSDVWKLCAYLVSPDSADDLTQETFLRAVPALARFKGESSARVWLLSIARRVCADAIRTISRGRRLLERTSDPEEESTPSASGLVELYDLIAQLDDDRREAFVLTQILGFSYAEAADACECPVGTIRSRVARRPLGPLGRDQPAGEPSPDRERVVDVDCVTCREALSAILDNEADLRERAAVSAHVAGCESCRVYGERIARVHRVVRVHPSEPVPELTSEIMRALPPLRRRRRRAPIAAGIGAIAAAAVGTLVVVSDDPVATSAAPNVEVSDVVVTQAPPGGVSVLSFTVRNRSNKDDALVAVTTPVAGNASLHATRDVEGRAEMQPVARIAVAPGQTRELGDATSHIMLLDLHEALEPGLTVQVELRFARAEPIDVDATVTA